MMKMRRANWFLGFSEKTVTAYVSSCGLSIGIYTHKLSARVTGMVIDLKQTGRKC